MAKLSTNFPDELVQKMSRLGQDTNRIIGECLTAAAVPVEQAVKQKYDQVVGRPHIVRRNGRLYNYGLRSTGALRRAIGTTKPRQDRKGNYDIKIGFANAREPETGIRCGYLAALITRGVKKRNQPPRPFIKPAEKASKAASLEAFERKFDEEGAKI